MQQQNKQTNRLVKYNKASSGLGFEYRVFELDTKKLITESGRFNSIEQAKTSAYKYLIRNK